MSIRRKCVILEKSVYFAPQLARIAPILRRLSARQTSLNSAFAFAKPRMLNWRNPRTFLIQPLGGSAIHLRSR
jgi:hypothetical protein